MRSAFTELVRTRRRTVRRLARVLIALAALVLICLSPLALLAIDTNRIDWNRLSSIGQSYGAISAVLSAAAVGGVAVTLILQNEQAKDARRFAVREMHRELLRMAIDRPGLLDAWGPFPARDTATPELAVYTNLVVNYLVLLHQTGAAKVDEIRAHARFMATGEWPQQYWSATAETWRAAFSGADNEIINVIDDEFQRARTHNPRANGAG
ncbi:MAG TPA: DUF6082 family protein [Rugosimonospora sp.]|nr:DUF6082 family protein [Rugosimonospora sp.]